MDRRHQIIIFIILSVLALGVTIDQWPEASPHKELATNSDETKISPIRVPQSEPSVTEKIKKINDTEACYQSFTCPFPQDDPRAYDIAVGKELAKNIKDFHNQYGGNPKTELILKELGLRFFKNENGFVQEAALDILKDFNPDQEILQAMIEGLENTYNPKITELSLPELAKYLGGENEAQVHGLLEKLMLGAHFSGEATSAQILNFINEKSYGFYQNLLKSLSPSSKNYQNLKSALSEYEKRQSGG